MATEDNKTTETPLVEDNLFKIKGYIRKFWRDALDLEHGVDKRLTINEIKNKKSMSGPNAWMLMCSIVIASVGLDMNSPAVIIGAMLISPLMSPILGIGLAVGINDKDTLKKSLAHFGMAVFIAIVTSTIYFALTPLGEITQQISDRTEPTPLDILIAFFGGIAGIVSIARKDISTTLPGVAIATALMPPVCVVGFGIANGSWDIALSSFFLFFINTVFVSFATYLIVRFFLHFPQRDFANEKEKRKNTYYIAAFLISIMVISYFPFNKLLKKRETNDQVEAFVEKVFEGKESLLDGTKLITKGDSSLLILKVYGDGKEFMSDDSYSSLCNELGLKNTSVRIVSTTNINEADLQALDNKIEGIQDLTGQLTAINKEKSADELKIVELQEKLNTFLLDDKKLERMSNMIKSINPEYITSVSYGKGQAYDFNDKTANLPIIIVSWSKEPREIKTYKKQIYNLMKADLGVETLSVAHIME